jgi:hypothetical protein
MIYCTEPATREDFNAVTPRGTNPSANLAPLDLSHSCAIKDGGGGVLGCAGVVQIFDGTAEVWAAFSDELLAHHKLSVTKIAKQMLARWQETGRFKRITAMTPQSRTHSAWLEVLGFQVEGVMHNFGPGASGDWCVMGLLGE